MLIPNDFLNDSQCTHWNRTAQQPTNGVFFYIYMKFKKIKSRVCFPNPVFQCFNAYREQIAFFFQNYLYRLMFVCRVNYENIHKRYKMKRLQNSGLNINFDAKYQLHDCDNGNITAIKYISRRYLRIQLHVTKFPNELKSCDFWNA